MGIGSMQMRPGLKRITDPVLGEMVRRLAKSLKPDRIYLFGSRARMTKSSGGDYDLMVVVGQSRLPGFRRDQKALASLYGVPAAKDVIVLTKREFDGRRKVVCSLPATVEREGRLIYQS